MNDRHVVEDLPAYVSGNLDDATARTVKHHLVSCVECNREAEVLEALWDELGRLPEERPGPLLEKGFHDMLRAYELGLRHPAAVPAQGRRLLDRLVVRRPALQFGFAAGMVLLGVFCGYVLNGSSRNAQELARLRDEVHGLGNLLTVSLLHQESASERLKGVSLSGTLAGEDPAIREALVSAMKHDRNVNVRLAALDALSRDIGSPGVRREIIRAFPDQSSPLMQIALVDILVQISDGESRNALQEALNRPGLIPEVRKRIQQGIQQLL